MVLESPRAGALFRIGDPKIAAALAALSAPQKISRFRRQPDFPGMQLLALLVDCQMLFKVGAAGGNLRAAEGDDDLVLWIFTICCSTPTAPKAGRPTRSAASIPMPA